MMSMSFSEARRYMETREQERAIKAVTILGVGLFLLLVISVILGIDITQAFTTVSPSILV